MIYLFTGYFGEPVVMLVQPSPALWFSTELPFLSLESSGVEALQSGEAIVLYHPTLYI